MTCPNCNIPTNGRIGKNYCIYCFMENYPEFDQTINYIAISKYICKYITIDTEDSNLSEYICNTSTNESRLTILYNYIFNNKPNSNLHNISTYDTRYNIRYNLLYEFANKIIAIEIVPDKYCTDHNRLENINVLDKQIVIIKFSIGSLLKYDSVYDTLIINNSEELNRRLDTLTKKIFYLANSNITDPISIYPLYI